ncbi:Pyrophosphate--fructose 6-phosphate 1-phosphotransferase subunit alpha 2 [Zea mays]|uniref:Pyrophosphate--fructose 6-phosphate 1-phosphotransferase subunit alpha 2 n=1 Tax=Zea mays TaxID=4577 RepID=A0A1D6LP92_MAIZE|nr:Pyrophosphate--fructose 6-phosphate 1-phosphotransferase subunit alpha 2 [Zea mays]
MTLATERFHILSASAVCSLQSLRAASPAKSELAEIVPQEKSPKDSIQPMSPSPRYSTSR